MSKEIYISSTPHETRLAIVEDDNLAEIYYERENEYTLAGSIYNGRVTRVLPGMQSSFVDIGLERDAFLYITDFMEEAGDSADFEATHAGGDPRPARGDGQRSQRSDRPDRGDRPAPLTIEGAAAPSSERSQENRGDRDRNGRGRNRRGRSDRGPAPDRDGAAESAPPAGEEELTTSPTLATDVTEVGEGAPGADGSRRWRGRRGRRRGRGNGLPGSVPRESGTEAAPAEHGEAEISEDLAETSDAQESFDAPPVFEAAAHSAPEIAITEADPSRSASPRSDVRRDGDRGGRNGRDDRGGRNSRDGRKDRNDRGDRGPRVPRGFEPSRSLYGVDAESGEGEVSAPAEPIILPGESLSKYRRATEAETAASETNPKPAAALAPNVVLAKPKNVIDDSFVATSWDGGAVLPGETLSRRSRSEGRKEGRSDNRRETQYRSEPQRSFVAPVPVDHLAETPKVIHDAEGLSVSAVAEEQPEVVQVAHPNQVPISEIIHETSGQSAEPEHVALLDPISAIPEPAAPEAEAASAEYEPQEASASYRVDPVAPSEFRQAAPIMDEPETERLEETVLHVDHSHPSTVSTKPTRRLKAPKTTPPKPLTERSIRISTPPAFHLRRRSSDTPSPL